MMRRVLILIVAAVAGSYAAAEWWRRNRRTGTRFVNEVVDPWLERQGLVSRSAGELAVIEHVGRRSGTIRHTLVHPEAVSDGVRILVPVGVESQWARNVIAAGHCRMQLGESVIELDEPLLVEPSEVADIPAPVRALYGWLGFRYLVLHRFAERAGTLDVPPSGELAEGQIEAPASESIPA
jgi:hypothetical protein